MQKALIPLPPTGFASVFYANPDVVQTILQPRLAVGLHGGLAISFCAKFCKKMQRDCTAALQVVTEEAGLEATVYKGYAFENVLFSEFSFSERVAPGALWGSIRMDINQPVGRAVHGL